jgi:hypothetical protein
MSDAPNEPSGLGSLAQSARSKNLKSARGILIAIGVLTVLVNGALFYFAPEMVRSQIQKEIGKAGPGNVDQAKVKEVEDTAVRETRVVAGGRSCSASCSLASESWFTNTQCRPPPWG